MSLPTLLAAIFITLKLIGYIAWSWWWVLAPLWIPVALIGVILTAVVCFKLVAILLEEKK